MAGASVAAFLVAQALGLVDPPPLVAALTALLVVQATAASTLVNSAQRVLSVVAGVALAVVFVSAVGLSWWSLFILVAVSIIVGQLLRLGPHLVEVPISAMLVLGVGFSAGAEVAGLGRVVETLVGAAVGVLVNSRVLWINAAAEQGGDPQITAGVARDRSRRPPGTGSPPPGRAR